jgi:hypothetical protein
MGIKITAWSLMESVAAVLAVRHLAGERYRYRVACPDEQEKRTRRARGPGPGESRGDSPSLSLSTSGRRSFFIERADTTRI